MKNKTKKTLGGLGTLVLAGAFALNPQNINAQRDYIEGTSQGTEYSDVKSHKIANYKLEGNVLFKEKNGKNDVAYFFKDNDDLDEGELDFLIYPADKTKIKTAFSGKTSLEGTGYIPTQLAYENQKMQEFELNDFDAKLKKKLIKKSRKQSENSFGYSFLIKDKDLKSIFPQITKNGKEYLYFDGSKGKYVICENDKKSFGVLNKQMLKKGEILPHILIPIENLDNVAFSINPDNGNITIISEEGFYIPTTNQEWVPSTTKQVPKSVPKSKTKKTTSSNKNQTNTSTSTPADTTSQTQINAQQEEFFYTIKSGDTFWNLSENLYGSGKDSNKLESLNPGVDPTKLKVGQKIKVPKKFE